MNTKTRQRRKHIRHSDPGSSFWSGRRVFVTGHSGFKGAWLCLWLRKLGASVVGYSLAPPTSPNLFELCGLDGELGKRWADVRDFDRLSKELCASRAEVVIHMAAQPLVRESYANPRESYEVNLMGTVNVLSAVQKSKHVRAVVNVTTDKCYENREWVWGYRENEPMGGHDPYSNSKACSELATAAYRCSFFGPARHAEHRAALATGRAGNVIGGGDWAKDRLVPDCMRAVLRGKQIVVRSPDAVRPWQHVLEPLSGYLLLAQRLVLEGHRYATGWNFGPRDEDARPVQWVVEQLCRAWGTGASYRVGKGPHPHEAHYLKLDCSKASTELGWRPRWHLEQSLGATVEWYGAYARGEDVRSVCLRQIEEYERSLPL